MRYMWRIFSVLVVLVIMIPQTVYAHCPLCTAGAGLAALGARWLGVSSMSVGVFIGAFSLAMGLWISRIIKKSYIPYQGFLIGLLSYVSIVIPLIPLMGDYTSVYISWIGQYGRTYVISRFLFGSLFGALIMLISPMLSQELARARKGKMIPYQGMALTFVLLFISALIIEFVL